MTKSTKPKSATSFKETAFGIQPRFKIILLEREGVKKAQEYIIKLNEDKAKVTPQLILNVHKVGFATIFPDWAGKWRIIEVTVGDYEPPHYSKIPELIKNLCDDLAEQWKHLPSHDSTEQFLAEVITLIAWFQHRLVWIHPFKDYNGRVARLISNLLLLKLGLPIASIKAETDKDRENYVKAMEMADQYDYSKLEELILNALEKSLEKV